MGNTLLGSDNNRYFGNKFSYGATSESKERKGKRVTLHDAYGAQAPQAYCAGLYCTLGPYHLHDHDTCVIPCSFARLCGLLDYAVKNNNLNWGEGGGELNVTE